MTGYNQGINTEGEPIRDFYVVHEPVNLDCASADDGMTRQEFKDECDINILMATYVKTGLPFNDKPLEYLDVSNVPDLMTALEYTQKAEAAFMSLKAEVRREFDNSALNFVSFASDPANIERMREWGLAPPAPEPVTSPSVASTTEKPA